MTPAEVAHIYDAHRVGDGQWRGKCPAHDGKSHTSLSVRTTNDGKTLLKCWAGCPTEAVLQTAGLSWADLFPDSEHYLRRPDPEVQRRHRADQELRQWVERTGREYRDRLLRRNQLLTASDRLLGTDRHKQGMDLLELAYRGMARLEWLCDLLDLGGPKDWREARQFLGVE